MRWTATAQITIIKIQSICSWMWSDHHCWALWTQKKIGLINMPVTSASITFRIISTSQPSIASIFFFGILSHTYVRAVEHAFTSDGIFAIDGLTKTMETIISFRCKLVLSVGLCSFAAWQQAQNEKNEFCQPKVIEMEYSGEQKKMDWSMAVYVCF